jgi:hypothetical protein
MTANNNRLGPTWNQTRHVFNDDGLAEDRTTQDVSNGAVWRAPHFFQAKFFNAAFIRRDRRAFDANTIFFNRFGEIDGDLVIGLITFFNAEILIFKIDIEIRQDQFVFDELPYDTCHFVTVEFNDWCDNFNFAHFKVLQLFGRQIQFSIFGPAGCTPYTQFL